VFVTFNVILINICVLPGYYVAHNGNILPKFRDKISILFFKAQEIKEILCFLDISTL